MREALASEAEKVAEFPLHGSKLCQMIVGPYRWKVEDLHEITNNAPPS
jgi:hypothetical protein